MIDILNKYPSMDKFTRIKIAVNNWLGAELMTEFRNKLKSVGIDPNENTGEFWMMTHFMSHEPPGGWDASHTSAWEIETELDAFIAKHLGVSYMSGITDLRLITYRGNTFGFNGNRAFQELENWFHKECEMLAYDIVHQKFNEIDYRCWAWKLPDHSKVIFYHPKDRNAAPRIAFKTHMLY